ncbi:hypothetical protein Tco_0438752 [Tanacetum coccineum]
MTKKFERNGLFSSVQQRTNHQDFQNCLFVVFPRKTQKVNHTLKDPKLDRRMQEELLYLSYKSWTLWSYLMEGAIELTFLLGLQGSRRIDGIILSQDKYVGEILKKFGFTKSRLQAHQWKLKSLCSRIKMVKKWIYQVNPKVSHLHAVKRIFRYLKGQLKLGLWYPKDSPFDLEAYTDSDYARASLDRKSTIGVAFLEKPTESEGFEEIIDFLNANPIKYALTVNPIVYCSCIKQFWATVKAKTVNGEV